MEKFQALDNTKGKEMKALYIQASPLEKESFSIKAANAFLERLGEIQTDIEVEALDLFKDEVPPFGAESARAKYTLMQGDDLEGWEKRAWRLVEELIERFSQADLYVFAVPMWNLSVPYVLKQYIDNLVQPGYTFDPMAPKGETGLLKDKSAFIAYSRGGEYGKGDERDPFDFQKPYLEAVLGLIGITDIRSVVVQPTLGGGPEVARQKLDESLEEARQAAGDFA